MMIDLPLKMTNVERRYGSATAVRDVTLELHEGEILCVLGPNGAGKTTTVKMASTLLAPTSGSITVRGIDAVEDPKRARAHLGLSLGGDRGFYLRASVMDNLRFFAELRGVRGRSRDHTIMEALSLVQLGDRAKAKVETLSRGMRQRLHVARAILGQPDVILFDEPSSGLDPENARGLRDLIAGLSAGGAAVLLTTHHMQEAEELADRIIVLDEGVVAVAGTKATIADAAGITAVTTFRASEIPDDVATWITTRVPGVVKVLADERHGAWTVDVMWSGSNADNESILEFLGDTAQHVVSRSATLEEAYLGFLEIRRSGSGAAP
jgi:ABC-2 type transport system ATP-binding protein